MKIATYAGSRGTTGDTYRMWVMVFFFTLVYTTSLAQSKPDIGKLAPQQALNLNKSAVPMMSAMVNVKIVGDLPESRACKSSSVAEKGLNIDISWYNKNDETGNMMLGFVSNKPDIEKKWTMHKDQLNEMYDHYNTPGNSLYCSKVYEEDVPGGKMHLIEYSYANCDTDKAQAYMVEAKCFFFNGSATGTIEISCQCELDEVRKMINGTISETSAFDFSSVTQ